MDISTTSTSTSGSCLSPRQHQPPTTSSASRNTRRVPLMLSQPTEIPLTSSKISSSVCCCRDGNNSSDNCSEHSLCSCPEGNTDNSNRIIGKTFSRSLENKILPGKALLGGGNGQSAFRNIRCNVYNDPVRSSCNTHAQANNNNGNHLFNNSNHSDSNSNHSDSYGQTENLGSNTNTPRETLEKSFEEIVNPLSTERLRPIRQKTRSVVLSIREDKSVSLEFIQNRNGKEFVLEIVRISSDGMKLTVYCPNGEFGVILQDSSVLQIPSSARTYDYDMLPRELYQKYQIAENFVRLVKMRTPKVRRGYDKSFHLASGIEERVIFYHF